MSTELYSLKKSGDFEAKEDSEQQIKPHWKLIPKSRIGQLLFFFIENFICFFIIVANTRAFTQGNYIWTIVTDTLFSAQSFFVAKLMIDDKDGRTIWAGAGSTIGGTLGSLASIWCTKYLYGN